MCVSVCVRRVERGFWSYPVRPVLALHVNARGLVHPHYSPRLCSTFVRSLLVTTRRSRGLLLL